MNLTTELNPEVWVAQYGDMLFRFALKRVNDTSLAEDLVQESMLAAMKAKNRFLGQSSEKHGCLPF
jgi:RNA polymerase sigma-70 factor, ECF subfamily